MLGKSIEEMARHENGRAAKQHGDVNILVIKKLILRGKEVRRLLMTEMCYEPPNCLLLTTHLDSLHEIARILASYHLVLT